MAVANKLAGFLSTSSPSRPVNDIIHSPFKDLKKVLSGDTFHPLRKLKVSAELALKNTVEALDLLLLPKLHPVIAEFRPEFAVHPRSIGTAFKGAFTRITA
jgi:hypothetical protein